MAAQQVLEQPPLLFEILQHLPQHDLLLAQRICRTWRHVISSTNTLQIVLFFRPDFDTPARADDAAGNTCPLMQLNPLLQSRFPAFFDQDLHTSSNFRDPHHLGPWILTHWYHGGNSKEVTLPPRFPHIQQRLAAYRRAEASWRRMIPCHPAPSEFFFYEGTLGPFSLQSMRYFNSRDELLRHNSFTGGRLRVQRFSNHREQQQHPSDNYGKQDMSNQPEWLIFGLLYDIIQQQWFRYVNMAPSAILIDFAPNKVSQMEHERAPARPLLSKHELCRLTLQKAQPGRDVMAPGKVYVYLGSKRGDCDMQVPIFSEELRFRDEFRSEASQVQDIIWHEVIFPL